MKTITIDPVTRLEGQGRIDIQLDDAGQVAGAAFIAAEFRGFERFCVGRPAEEMPRITTRICGVCPTAHHAASMCTLDNLFKVTPPPAARAIRELVYSAFMLEDHLLHFFVLGGPDLLMAAGTPAAKRNVIGLTEALGVAPVKAVIEARRLARGIIERLGGKVVHPVMGLPGGVSRAADAEVVALAKQAADHGAQVVGLAVELLHGPSAIGERLRGRMREETEVLRTHYLGLVADDGSASYLDGKVRVITPDGAELAWFDAVDYEEHIAERVDPKNYMKSPYLKQVGWRGCVDGPASGVYRVGPMARLNVAKHMRSPLAEAERQRLFDFFGGAPVHAGMANHWARLIECLEVIERIRVLAESETLLDPRIRAEVPKLTSGKGIACVEAPRGALLHHYECDDDGILTRVNLIVATVHNTPAINLAVERAARRVLVDGGIEPRAPSEVLLNEVEVAFRAYDPCLACATHALPGTMPLRVRVFCADGRIVHEWMRIPISEDSGKENRQ